MEDYVKILQQYWGYDSFRALQDEIIHSVGNGIDTLALMPTGGGKSITFQVPAMAKEGICIVITPLIALMKDQVENLKSRKIKALAIHSGLNKEEISIALDNCAYGDFKFLYISPERIGTEIFQARVKKMNVNLIAVDEAHCISQWGYDFRPAYLKIAELRNILPDVPVLALTATATPGVVKDIQQKLHFKKEHVLQKSFERKNVAYVIRQTESKTDELEKIVKKLRGTGIIYVRNRKKTKEIAFELQKHGISAGYYHAGLNYDLRMKRQEDWKKNEIRVMVTTNAFGMGIDKPDVRFVIHIDPPDSLEEYFQEAGRAGRDEKKSYAILLFHKSDIANLKRRLSTNYPESDTIKRIYSSLFNFYKIPYGGGKGISLDFDIIQFSSQYKLNPLIAFNALKILEKEGYFELTDEIHNPSKVHFLINRDDLYKFQVSNLEFDKFIKLLLRNYAGLFSDYVSIYESDLAMKAGTTNDVIFGYLNRLKSLKIIQYIPQRKTPLIVLTEERLEERSVYISKENLKLRKERFEERINHVIYYISTENQCRSQILLSYFGEKKAPPCGQCDYCLKKNDKGITHYEFQMIKEEIKLQVEKKPMDINLIVNELKYKDDHIIEVIRWLLDEKLLIRNVNDEIIWNNQ